MRCLAIFLFIASLQALALDRGAFTFTQYDLNVRIEPGQQRLAVRGTITLRNDSAFPQKNLVLQISSTLNWLSIQLENKPVQFLTHTYTSDIDHTGALSEAVVTLSTAVPPKRTVELQIGYEGVIPQDATRLARSGVPNDAGKHTDWDRISPSFTAIRGVGYVAWYPIASEAVEITGGAALSKEVGRWKRRSTDTVMTVNLCITGESGQATTVVNDEQSSSLAASQPNAGTPAGCGTHSFSLLGSAVPSVALADFSTIQKSGVLLHYLPGDQSAADNYGLALEEASTLLTRLFGASPETFNLTQAVDLDDPEAEPFQSGNTLFVPFKAKDSVLLLSAVQQLTLPRFPSPRTWISGGLARFAQLALLNERGAKQEPGAFLQSQADSVRLAEKQNMGEGSNGGERNSLINSPDEFYAQTKGASVWWMLRGMIGETAFRSALSNYKPAEDRDPSYVQRLFEAQTHTDLAWFFDDWVYRDRGLPDMKIDSVYPRKLANGYLVTVTVENQGNAGAEVPVTVHTEQGEASEHLLVPRKSTASVRVSVPSKPVQVTVNDGSVPEMDIRNNSYTLQSVSSAAQ